MSNRIIQIELETVTPVFIGGATPRRIDPHTPIRASAVRGMLRTWFRAAAGAVLVPSTLPGGQKLLIKELARLEAQVFGNTERVSPFAVLAPEAEQVRAAVEHIPPGAPDRDRWAGLRYLGYGLFEDKIKGAQALAERKRFALRLALRKSGRHEQAGLRELLSATAWLWLNLGALGARSRRGFGGLRLYPGEHIGLLCPEDLLVPPAHHQALGEHLARGMKWAWEVFYQHLPASLGKRPPDHDDGTAAAVPVRSLAGIESFAALPHEFSDARDALDYTGRLFRDYRSTLERGKRGQAPLSDYTSVKAGLQLKRPPGSVERAAFGLPLPFYFRSLGGVRTMFVPELPDGKPGDRLASPLCMRICPVGDASSPRYVPVLYNWAEGHGAQPLLGCGLHDTASRGRVTRAPDSGIITSFIDWARRQPRRSVSTRPPRGR